MARNKLSNFEIHIREEISQNLKRIIKNKGITQTQLSDKSGIPASTLSGYFAKRSTPNVGMVQKLSDTLNVEKSDIDPRCADDFSEKENKKVFDLKKAIDNDELMSYGGKEISPLEKEMVKRILEERNND
ncbi:XRE family transcriptional regulator [Apilactobacillus timberlakei]|uniref:helix-turn-helix domain-containing protein n=1 Tax=Apilactobacillus timberlakei TaxID=2008380 RepID=UPI00112B0BB3|nr:helix-turn-helix transcriptional regulator [Apilactobacillus timberlakei]TPR19957.1 XRE family transcriptional regulator [Apilactobacillus timberlakei]TPR21675.1 XRE family transcriptional regulator [Apilactobacillus timberlakei]TPR22921.1 XRE family transcriptional regulator [Apilactobacillus timberlakei]